MVSVAEEEEAQGSGSNGIYRARINTSVSTLTPGSQAVGSWRGSAAQVGDGVRESEEHGSSGLEAEVSPSSQNWLPVQTELVRDPR